MTTIRIRKSPTGEWLTVQLVYIGVAWLLVDDGLGRLWVMREHVHPEDKNRLFANRRAIANVN